ncbi:MAG: rane dipeptidase, partial [Geminicoccaceae bacterium]|nr:rane dipeptidase [Geminicoccaceae bacterium]
MAASPRPSEDQVSARPPADPPPGADRLPILDGHNDALLALLRNPERPDSLLERSAIGHLDLPRAADGGFAGGFFALFTPSRRSTGPRPRDAAGPYELPFPPTPGVARAQRFTGALAARLFRDERASGGRLKVVRTLAELRDCLERGVCAAILHIEGAEAIDPGLDALEVLYQTGLRSLGLVWSRPDAFGHGVPFKFPSSPDTGPGLTDRGQALVEACNQLGVLIDLSHLNEQGFWDVARLSQAPLVATHSNAHALCPSARNLTDDQLRAIRESGGMVGLNFAVSMLRADGGPDAATPLEVMVRHLDHLIERLGEDKVGFGSDF